jgi:hypothetical protein
MIIDTIKKTVIVEDGETIEELMENYNKYKLNGFKFKHYDYSVHYYPMTYYPMPFIDLNYPLYDNNSYTV